MVDFADIMQDIVEAEENSWKLPPISHEENKQVVVCKFDTSHKISAVVHITDKQV